MDSRPKCKSETIKPLKYYNIGENLHAIIPGNNYLDMMSKIQATKEKIDKLDFITVKNFSFFTPGLLPGHRCHENHR